MQTKRRASHKQDLVQRSSLLSSVYGKAGGSAGRQGKDVPEAMASRPRRSRLSGSVTRQRRPLWPLEPVPLRVTQGSLEKTGMALFQDLGSNRTPSSGKQGQHPLVWQGCPEGARAPANHLAFPPCRTAKQSCSEDSGPLPALRCQEQTRANKTKKEKA